MKKCTKSRKLVCLPGKYDIFTRACSWVHNHANKIWASGTQYKCLWKLVLIQAAKLCSVALT